MFMKSSPSSFEKIKSCAINSFDIFGQIPSFMVLKKNKFKTLIGLLTTLIIGGLTFIYLTSEVLSMIIKSEPAVVSTEFQVFETESYQLFNDNFTLAVSVSNKSGTRIIGNGLYYNITLSQCMRKRIIGDNGAQNVSIECQLLPLEPCNMSHFTTEVQIQYFQKMKFGAMQCINRDYLKQNPPQLQGQFNAIIQKYIEIQLKPCVNSSDIQTCAPVEEINKVLMNGHYMVYMSDYLMQQSDSKEPYKQIINSDITSFSLSTSKVIQTYYSIIETINDDGLLFQSLSTATNLKLRDRKESSDFYNQDFLVDHYIALDYRSQQYSRTYIKVQAILSKIGGIWQIFIIIVGSIIKPFINCRMNIAIANKIYRFPQTVSNSKKVEGPLDTSNFEEKEGPLPNDFLSILQIMTGFNKSRKKQLDAAKKLIMKNLDIVKIVQKLQEIEVLKQILLSEDQFQLFSVLPKPLIGNQMVNCKLSLFRYSKKDPTQIAFSFYKIMNQNHRTSVDERLLSFLDKRTIDQLQQQTVLNYSPLASPKTVNSDNINEPNVHIPI